MVRYFVCAVQSLALEEAEHLLMVKKYQNAIHRFKRGADVNAGMLVIHENEVSNAAFWLRVVVSSMDFRICLHGSRDQDSGVLTEMKRKRLTDFL